MPCLLLGQLGVGDTRAGRGRRSSAGRLAQPDSAVSYRGVSEEGDSESVPSLDGHVQGEEGVDVQEPSDVGGVDRLRVELRLILRHVVTRSVRCKAAARERQIGRASCRERVS